MFDHSPSVALAAGYVGGHGYHAGVSGDELHGVVLAAVAALLHVLVLLRLQLQHHLRHHVLEHRHWFGTYSERASIEVQVGWLPNVNTECTYVYVL